MRDRIYKSEEGETKFQSTLYSFCIRGKNTK